MEGRIEGNTPRDRQRMQQTDNITNWFDKSGKKSIKQALNLTNVLQVCYI